MPMIPPWETPNIQNARLGYHSLNPERMAAALGELKAMKGGDAHARLICEDGKWCVEWQYASHVPRRWYLDPIQAIVKEADSIIASQVIL